MSFSLGVIGLGRIAQAIILPLLDRGEFLPSEIFAVVGTSESALSAKNLCPAGMKIVPSDNSTQEEVWRAPIQLLAVKPNQLQLIAEQVPEKNNLGLPNKPLLISVLAGINLQKLQSLFPGHICVRAVPNTPSLIGQGLTGLSWGEGITASHKKSVKNIFDPISKIFELPEQQMDAFLALTSSGPAYVALIVEALSDGAVAVGLPRSLANELTNQTIAGTVALLLEKNLHPSQLKDMVASPGGTTIAALRHLEKAGLRSALMEAVVAAAERSRELN